MSGFVFFLSFSVVLQLASFGLLIMRLTPSRLTTCLGLIVTALSAHAQTELGLPDRSRAAVVQQRLGVTDITIRYHRPLVDGRKIWGALVPYDKVWRAGANINTTIEVSDPISVEGKPLPGGLYGLHMIPTADFWTIIFSKAADSWGSYTYDQAEDVLRVTVKPHPAEMQEALQYTFEDVKADSAAVTLRWEKLAVPFRVAVNDQETVLPYIRKKMRGFQRAGSSSCLISPFQRVRVSAFRSQRQKLLSHDLPLLHRVNAGLRHPDAV